MARRVAIVGIDGSGKSALVHRLRDRLGAPRGPAVAFNCPAYHETPDAPFGALSAELKALSDAADRVASHELKLAALYLRMTLYGPVESFFERALAPALIVSDRHPLVDTLVYVPLYRRRIGGRADGARLEPALLEELAGTAPGALDSARAWHAAECRRLGREVDFWAIAADVVEAFARPPAEVVDEFARRYRTALPDAVVLLDVDPAEAARRSAGRGVGARELHEDERALHALRAGYDELLGRLGELRPGIETLRLSNSGRSLDETLDELLAALGAAAAQPA